MEDIRLVLKIDKNFIRERLLSQFQIRGILSGILIFIGSRRQTGDEVFKEFESMMIQSS